MGRKINEIIDEGQVIGETSSLCPQCLRRIDAFRIEMNGHIFMVKACPDHGSFKTIIWREDAEHYLTWGKFGQSAVGPLGRLTRTTKGCPYDCGLCPEHEANACTMVVEVTGACNLRCPICFADAGSPGKEPSQKNIRERYQTILEKAGTPAIQLSGGEPTIRDDLHDIIFMGRGLGFDHILVNTNGIRIAKDPDYLNRLLESGAGTIYLQFDGVTPETHSALRGSPLTQLKERAIQNCGKAGIGVILVVTLVPGKNNHQMGEIIRFAKDRIPTVRGVHFQPVSYLGRYPVRPKDGDRITMPEVISGLEEQTGGELKAENFLPRRSQDAHCAFSSLFVREENRLKPMTRKRSEIFFNGRSGLNSAPWESARSFINIHWQMPCFDNDDATYCSVTDMPETPGNLEMILWDKIQSRIKTSGLSITCMPFQDVWTLDLERLRRCCGHVVTQDLKIFPFCAYYMTSSSGQRLYSIGGDSNG
jgi:uncharacterized radical SAM superfamily Fe-S cluster-containing enzyme